MYTAKTCKTLCLATLLACSGGVLAEVADPLHIAGSYKCTGYDSHDGAFKGNLTFMLDEKVSNFAQSFGAYKFVLEVPLEGATATYSGFAAVQGQQLAMYFANDSQEAATDRGVGITVVSHDQDSKGQYTTTLHKSYYLPDYMGGGRGTETCVKTAGA
jgi:hypothetical protein